MDLLPSRCAYLAYSDVIVAIPKTLNSTVMASFPRSNPQPLHMFYEDPVLLQETGDVLFGAGRPGEGGAVVHELPGHDERVPPLQLAVVALPVVMNPKAVVTPQLITTSPTNTRC